MSDSSKVYVFEGILNELNGLLTHCNGVELSTIEARARAKGISEQEVSSTRRMNTDPRWFGKGSRPR